MSQRVHSQPELSVVIAVGDQEDSIGHLIRNVAAHLSSLGRSFEILVVNAGCKDNSLSIASVLAATMPEIEVLARDAAGRAFLRGTSEARGDVVVLVDASKPALAGAARRGRCPASPRGATRSCCAAATWSPAGSRCCRSIVRASGPGVLFEAVFERRAQELGIDIVGSRPRRPVPLLLRPVLRFLAA